MKRILAARAEIKPLDYEIMERVRRRLDSLTKPPGSLDALETMVAVLAGARRAECQRLPIKTIVLMAADHGVATEGVSAYPQKVTAQMVYNFVRGGAGINVFARHAAAELLLVDVGVAADFPVDLAIRHCKIRAGTANMRYEPAMTRQEALAAMHVGMDIAGELADAGVEVVGLGEMGIGNTTASSAITSVLLGKPVSEVTGLGTGISSIRLAHKVSVIAEAIAVNRPDPCDPVDVVAKVGGLEIAALAGLVLGCAVRRILVMLDGFISTVAALIAYRLAPEVQPYLTASHLSPEPGHSAVLAEMGLEPKLNLGLRLGEGAGAAIAMTLLDASVKMLNEMTTFAEAEIAGALPDIK